MLDDTKVQTNVEQTRMLTKEFLGGLLVQLILLGLGGIWAFSSLSSDVEHHETTEHVSPEKVARLEENSKRLEQKIDENTRKLDRVLDNQQDFQIAIAELLRNKDK